MRATAGGILTAALLLGAGARARGDVITDWNDTAVAAGYAARQIPPLHNRNVAMVNVAMFDAVNSIDRRYAPFLVQLSAPAGAARDAAAAAAAHFVLVRLYPDQAPQLDAILRSALAALPEGSGTAEGVRLGERVAAAVLDQRQSDVSDAPSAYRPFTTAGTYVPTVFPVGTSWGSVKPWALKAGSQFRPPAPYALTSAQWAKDYNEVKRMGGRGKSERSADQTEIASFWDLTGPGTYMPVVRQIVAAKRLDLLDGARIFALSSVVAADAMIAILDAKYTYNFWRPVTAIRNGDLDGNDATERDATWEPFITTPMHPEYPCAHCITQSAVATVLESVAGDGPNAFTLTSTTAPGVTRRFARLSDYVAEVVNARVYDGVHFRTSGEVGAAMGRRIGEYTVRNRLQPAAP
jgi:hypothetical protein